MSINNLAPQRPVIRPVAPQAQRPTTTQVQRPAPQPQAAPKGPAAKPQNADSSFGSDIFQSFMYGVMNLGMIVKLPGGVSQIIGMLPPTIMGGLNVVMGGMSLFNDFRGLSKANNTRKWDDTIRLASGAAVVVGGIGILAGAMISPVVPLIGAGLAVAGYFGRTVGVWNDDTRI